MRTAFRYPALLCLLALPAGAAFAQAAQEPFFAAPHEVILDMDGNAIMDRARIVPQKGAQRADLFIYLDAGNTKPDGSRKPSFVRKNLDTPNLLLGFEARGNRRLVLTYGCGGCRNDFSTALTIAWRNGEFWVAGYTHDWETPDSAGRCDINFLTGKGKLSKGINTRPRPLKGRFRPVKLAHWQDDLHRPKACKS